MDFLMIFDVSKSTQEPEVELEETDYDEVSWSVVPKSRKVITSEVKLVEMDSWSVSKGHMNVSLPNPQQVTVWQEEDCYQSISHSYFLIVCSYNYYLVLY